LLLAADQLDMVIEITLFCQEKNPNLPPGVQDIIVKSMASRLMPYRNILLQIWNEKSFEVMRYFRSIKHIDPHRIVTNSPGFSNDLGDDEQNNALDVLTPHTVRGEWGTFWEDAPRQLESLAAKFVKPIIDGEPARSGPIQFGGISGGTQPGQHIEQIKRVRSLGFYHVYHHDMFQYKHDPLLTPPNGIPDPDFSPFHRQVFDYLKEHRQWSPLQNRAEAAK
jgi:hypothetical protein